MNFSNFRIASKIGAGFAVIVAVIVALGIVALSQLSVVSDGVEQLATNNLPSVEMAGQLSLIHI